MRLTSVAKEIIQRPLKNKKSRINIFLKSGVTCPNLGLMNQIIPGGSNRVGRMAFYRGKKIFKGIVQRDFLLRFFYEWVPPKLLT